MTHPATLCLYRRRDNVKSVKLVFGGVATVANIEQKFLDKKEQMRRRSDTLAHERRREFVRKEEKKLEDAEIAGREAQELDEIRLEACALLNSETVRKKRRFSVVGSPGASRFYKSFQRDAYSGGGVAYMKQPGKHIIVPILTWKGLVVKVSIEDLTKHPVYWLNFAYANPRILPPFKRWMPGITSNRNAKSFTKLPTRERLMSAMEFAVVDLLSKDFDWRTTIKEA